MKTVAVIGDLHGCNKWQSVEFHDFDKVVFLGDYCDSWVAENVEIIHNLKALIEFKQKNPDKVILLYGNHDLSYALGFDKHGCSGNRGEIYFDLNDLFRKNKELFQCAYQIDNYIFTHAGLTSHWYNKGFLPDISDEIKKLPIADQLNYAFEHNDHSLFIVGRNRGGRALFGGPFWADKAEFGKFDLLQGYHQIVGHNPVDKQIKHQWSENESITFCDTRNENGILTIHEFKI